MFKKIFFKIKNFKANKQKKAQQRQENLMKYYRIRNAVIDFFRDKQITDNTVELPPFIKADQLLLKKIKTPSDLNYYYNKLIIHNQTSKAVA